MCKFGAKIKSYFCITKKYDYKLPELHRKSTHIQLFVQPYAIYLFYENSDIIYFER